jgi:hypothetical protein
MTCFIICLRVGSQHTRIIVHMHVHGMDNDKYVKFEALTAMTVSVFGMCMYTTSHATKLLSSTGNGLPHNC